MQRSGRRTGKTEAEQPVRGAAAARRETSSAGAAVPPPLTADVLRAAQGGAGNAAVTGMIARRARTAPAPEQLDTGVPEVLNSGGKKLAAPIRAEMESRFSTDFSDVRLHTGTAAARSARAIGARAYTSGSHVVIGPGGGDKHTLAHELTHVVQQRQGPVAGTDNGAGLRVSNPSDRFEREAESNATRVMSRPVQRLPHAHAHEEGCTEETSAASAPPVQRAEGVPVQRAKDDTIGVNIAGGLRQYDAQVAELATAVGTTPQNVLNALLDPAYDPMGAHAIDAQILDMNLKDPIEYASCFPTAHALFPVLTDPPQAAPTQGPNPEKAGSLEEFQAAVQTLINAIQESWNARTQTVFRIEYAGHGFTLVIRQAGDGEFHVELIESLAHAAGIIPSLERPAFELNHVLEALFLMAHPGVEDRVRGAGMLGWNAHALYLGDPSPTEQERFPETRMRWWRLPLSQTAGGNWFNQLKLRFNFVAQQYGTAQLP